MSQEKNCLDVRTICFHRICRCVLSAFLLFSVFFFWRCCIVCCFGNWWLMSICSVYFTHFLCWNMQFALWLIMFCFIIIINCWFTSFTVHSFIDEKVSVDFPTVLAAWPLCFCLTFAALFHLKSTPVGNIQQVQMLAAIWAIQSVQTSSFHCMTSSQTLGGG